MRASIHEFGVGAQTFSPQHYNCFKLLAVTPVESTKVRAQLQTSEFTPAHITTSETMTTF